MIRWHILRGGSWYRFAKDVRASRISYECPGYRSLPLSFRICIRKVSHV